MTPDIKLNDYYYAFIGAAKKDIAKYKEEIAYYSAIRDKTVSFIQNNVETYITEFKIYVEDEDVAIRRAELLIKTETDSSRKFLLAQLTKLSYCNRMISQYETMIKLADKRKNLKYRDFETLAFKYYNVVHRYVLQGFGYEYGHGIGTLCICRWKCNNPSTAIDYNATKINKEKLLAEGKKLWNSNEAKWYKERGLPYDGIDYRVYSDVKHVYAIDIVKSKLFSFRAHKFEHNEYINSKYKSLGFKAMADLCKDINDIANFQCDIRYKLNMLLHKDPSNYILYIRNDEEQRREYGAHNS